MLQSLNYFTYQERHFSIKYNNFDICLKVFQLRRQILLPTKYSIPCCIVKASLILDIESNIFHLAIMRPCLKIQEHLLYYLLHYLKWSSNVKNVILYNGQITQSNKVIFLHCLKVILLHEDVKQKFRCKEKMSLICVSYFLFRINYDVACPMNFKKYPYDTQLCKIKYESCKYINGQFCNIYVFC